MDDGPAKRLPSLPNVKLPELPKGSVLRWLGYAAFFALCFMLFAYWSFPYERVRDRLVKEAAKQGYELEVIDLGPAGISGVTLEGVRLVLPAKADEPAMDVLFDELTVKASLLSALADDKGFSFDVAMAGGDASGDVTVGKENFEIDAEFSDLDFAQIPALRRFTKVPMGGTLNGKIELTMPPEPEESAGEIDLTIDSMKLGDGETKVEIPGWGGLTLDEADAGNLVVKVAIDNGVAEIDTVSADGSDIKLDAVGSIDLARPLRRSFANLMVRVKLEESYKERSPKVATMLELASSGRDYKNALTPDGWLQYGVSGVVAGRLRPTAAGKEPFKAPTRGSKRP